MREDDISAISNLYRAETAVIAADATRIEKIERLFEIYPVLALAFGQIYLTGLVGVTDKH